jgi:hypothetical protein
MSCYKRQVPGGIKTIRPRLQTRKWGLINIRSKAGKIQINTITQFFYHLLLIFWLHPGFP